MATELHVFMFVQAFLRITRTSTYVGTGVNVTAALLSFMTKSALCEIDVKPNLLHMHLF